MNSAARLGAYGLVLIVSVAGGAAVGSAAGPIDVAGGPGEHTDEAGAVDHEPAGACREARP